MIGTALAIGAGALAAGSIAQDIFGQKAAGEQRDAAMAATAPTSSELLNLSSANQLAQQNLQYQQQSLSLLNSQYQKLLQGQSTPFLDPLERQLSNASQNNMNRLFAQFGSGADSSSAGIRAQAMFGQSAAETRSNAQMQALQLFGGQQTQALNSAFGGLQTANGMQNQIDQRQLQAAGYAGADQYGGLALGNQLSKIGGTLAGYGITNTGVPQTTGQNMTGFNNFLNSPSTGSTNYGLPTGSFGS